MNVLDDVGLNPKELPPERRMCDQCGAEAYLFAILPSGKEVAFCAHDGRRHKPKLEELGATIDDQSDRLANLP
jgi:hypothetical protein